MDNYRRSGGKTRLRVGGRMSEKGADRAGLLLAVGGLLLGVGALIASAAALAHVLL